MNIENIVLLVVYNHRYDQNIDKVERLYRDKFKSIYHIIPFYDGEHENVLAVYESSFYFSGYVAQAKKQLDNRGVFFRHYFIIADDMVLNPIIDEKSYAEIFTLDDQTSFLPGLSDFAHIDFFSWDRAFEALSYNPKLRGVEIQQILPEIPVAIEKFISRGLSYDVCGTFSLQSLRIFKHPLRTLRALSIIFLALKRKGTLRLDYPLVSGYADIFIVSGNVMDQFCTYAGAFAATNLFVEIAVPTAMVLSANKLVQEVDLKLNGRALWSKDDLSVLDKYQYKINNLLDDFPSSYLYLHPIKLSKWSFD